MRTLNLFGPVGKEFDGICCANVTSELGDYKGPLTVRINSPGGVAHEGIAVYNLLKPYEPSVEVLGLAASAASVIAMAGKTIHVAKGAELMIHDAWGIALGNAETMAKMSADLEHVSESLALIYAERTGKEPEEMRALMKAETWMRDAEAIALGFADEVVEKKAKPAANAQEVLDAMACRGLKDPLRINNATRKVAVQYALRKAGWPMA